MKLLRVLQDQTFEVLGDSRPRKTDIRVVSATNADLAKMVSEHTFREDLFYRINLITIKLPALRERREDIPLLARHFADRQAEINNLPRTEFSSDALNFLSRLPFPGNIRELKIWWSVRFWSVARKCWMQPISRVSTSDMMKVRQLPLRLRE